MLGNRSGSARNANDLTFYLLLKFVFAKIDYITTQEIFDLNFADLAKTILHCYHDTARYQLAEVTQTPWDQEGRYGRIDDSALILIRYSGAISGDLYEMNVALVSRQAQIRTAVVNDNSPLLSNANCQLESWTTLAPSR